MSDDSAPAREQAARLAEYGFITEGMRQDQKERHRFLAIALAANGLIYGILFRLTGDKGSEVDVRQAVVLTMLSAVIVCVAERMTIRATTGVATAGAYLRLYVEPHVPGLAFQARNNAFRQAYKKTKRRRLLQSTASASASHAWAYLALTAAFVVAWFACEMDGRQWWQTGLVLVAGVLSLAQIAVLFWGAEQGYKAVNDAWEAVIADESPPQA